jgi:hypothetical protein
MPGKKMRREVLDKFEVRRMDNGVREHLVGKRRDAGNGRIIGRLRCVLRGSSLRELL